jgi:hypothetical protein
MNGALGGRAHRRNQHCRGRVRAVRCAFQRYTPLARSACQDCNSILNVAQQPREPSVGRKIEIGSVMQLSGKRDAALPALASPPPCRSGNPALSEPVRKGLASLSSDTSVIG